MCGIHLSVSNCSSCTLCEQLQQQASPKNLRRRGPDAWKEVAFDVSSSSSTNPDSFVRYSLQASVLQMRQDLVEQPVTIDISHEHPSYYLCWNGEVYQARDDETAGSFETSDTRLVANRLSLALATGEPQQAITNVLSDLYNAEYAFLILTSDGDIYYGRDSWGRRSLLRWDCPECGSFHIASTPPFNAPVEVINRNEACDETIGWQEIRPGLVHAISSSKTDIESMPLTITPKVLSSRSLENLMVQSTIPPGVTPDLWNASCELEYHLSNAVKRRMEHHSTAILFSGGLDSAVVAALAARHCTHTLHLYNVSFAPSHEQSADRQAALITHKILQTQYTTDKEIIFKDIVVSWDDICATESHIRTILQPKDTLMDVNIATALWFASGGGEKEGVRQGNKMEKMTNQPRVLLLGMGADELLGGYGRHRKAFQKGGWDKLRQELEMDQSRFWERNLGRDDRIIADHGTEARFPFLDSDVTNYLNTLPLSSICDFTLPPGHGDKRILRLVATRLGLEHASCLVKRAIQFGSRISHLSDAKRFGSRRKANGGVTIKMKQVNR